MESNRINWGRLYDFPEWKAFKRLVQKRKEDAIADLIATKPSDIERMARAQERISDCEWILSESFEENNHE